MTGISTGANVAIVREFPWSRYKTVVDAGTAQVDVVLQIALANPHIQGIGFDLSEVAPIFEDYVAEGRAFIVYDALIDDDRARMHSAS